MRFDGERILDALDALLRAGMNAALDVVEGRWTSDPYTLPNPVTYHKGFTMMLVEEPSTAFPYIVTMVPQEQPSQQGVTHVGKVQYTAVIQAWVIADTEAEVKRLVYRYAEAICDVLQSQKVIAGYVQASPLPRVQASESARHLKEGTTGDFTEADDVDYLRMVELEIALEGE